MSGAEPSSDNRGAPHAASNRDGGERGSFQAMPLHRQPEERCSMRKAYYICFLLTMSVITIVSIVAVILFFTGKFSTRTCHADVKVSPPMGPDRKLMRRIPGHFQHGFFNDSGTIGHNDTIPPFVTLTDVHTQTAFATVTQSAETSSLVLNQTVSAASETTNIDVETTGIGFETVSAALGVSTSVPLSESFIIDFETTAVSTPAVETVHGSNFTHFPNTTVTQTQAVSVDLIETVVSSLEAEDIDTTEITQTITDSFSATVLPSLVVFETSPFISVVGETSNVPFTSTAAFNRTRTVTEVPTVSPFIVSTSHLEPTILETTLAFPSDKVDDATASLVILETTITYTPTVVTTISTITEPIEQPVSTIAADDYTTIESVTTIEGHTTTVQVTHEGTVTETFTPNPTVTEVFEPEESICHDNTVYITVTREVIPIPADSFISEVIEISTVEIEEPQMSVITVTTTIFPSAEETLTTSDAMPETGVPRSTMTETFEDVDPSISRTTVTQTIYPTEDSVKEVTQTEVLTVTDTDALTSTLLATESVEVAETTLSRTTVTVYHGPESSSALIEEVETVVESVDVPETHLTRTTITIYPPEEAETESVIVEDEITETPTPEIETVTTEVQVDEPFTSYRTVVHTQHVTQTLLTTISNTQVEQPPKTSEVIIESDVLEHVTLTEVISDLTTITVTHSAGVETTLTSALVVPPPVPEEVSSYSGYSFGNTSTEIVTVTGDVDVPAATDEDEFPSASETIVIVSGSDKLAEPGAPATVGSTAFFGLTLAIAGLVILV